MTKGFDCASSLDLSTATTFYNDGYRFVCRYLVPTGWKRLTINEAKNISQSGLKIVSVFEITANSAMNGNVTGKEDGETALQCAKDIGQPEGSTIYFTVDFEAKESEMDFIEAYIRAASLATPNYPTGIYGSYAVIEEMKKRGACSHFWQTYAWSYGQVSDNIQTYQSVNDTTVHGVQVDIDEMYINEGSWDVMQIPKSDGDKFIAICREMYKLGVTKLTLPDDTVIDVDQNEFHRLADVARTISGQSIV